MISTGGIGLLRDQPAKAAIADYYASFDDLRQWDELLRQQQSRYWSNFRRGPAAPGSAGGDPRPGATPDARAGRGECLDKARARQGLRDLLVGMAAHQERVRRDSEGMANKGRALIEKLQALEGRAR